MSDCPLCASPGNGIVWTGKGRRGVDTLRRCTGCGAAFADPTPPADVLGAHYDGDYFRSCYGGERGAAVRRDERFLAAAEERLGAKGVVLDVGCGVGDLCAAAQARGWSAVGIEPAEEAAGRTRARGAPVIVQDAVDALESSRDAALDGPFDLVVFRDVLAHLPRAGAALQAACRRLRAGGWLAVRTPNRHAGVFRAARLAERLADGAGVLHLPAQILHLESRSLAAALDGIGLVDVSVTGEAESCGGPVRYSRSAVMNLLWRLQVLAWRVAGRPESLWAWGRKP